MRAMRTAVFLGLALWLACSAWTAAGEEKPAPVEPELTKLYILIDFSNSIPLPPEKGESRSPTGTTRPEVKDALVNALQGSLGGFTASVGAIERARNLPDNPGMLIGPAQREAAQGGHGLFLFLHVLQRELVEKRTERYQIAGDLKLSQWKKGGWTELASRPFKFTTKPAATAPEAAAEAVSDIDQLKLQLIQMLLGRFVPCRVGPLDPATRTLQVSIGNATSARITAFTLSVPQASGAPLDLKSADTIEPRQKSDLKLTIPEQTNVAALKIAAAALASVQFAPAK